MASLIFVFMAIKGKLGCDPDTGPAGLTQCFLGTPFYTKYQCGTCLTDAYIRQRSRGQHGCRDTTATYCYYPCLLEKYGLYKGPVYDDCLCNASVPLPQPPVILPPGCYIPDGTDCTWYSKCLHKMFPCTGRAEYAIGYGEKICNLSEKTEVHLSQKGLQWINAVRKCLQVALVPVLYLCQVQPTCKEIKTKAFKSHVPCYLKPYKGSSICSLPARDWLWIFWTIKSSFRSAFLDTLKASLDIAADCAGIHAQATAKKLFSVDLWLWQKYTEIRDASDIMSDDELAHAVMLHVSSSLRWHQDSTMDWYAFATNTTYGENFFTTPSTIQPERQLTIQVGPN